MTPPPRRSNRNKRPPVKFSEEPAAKRPKQAATTPQLSKHSGSRRTLASRVSNSAEPTYHQCEQTVFLGNGLDTLHWIPPPISSKFRKPLTLLREFDFNTHEYFKTVRAGTHAASLKLLMYRHVGSIFLDGFAAKKSKTGQESFESILTSKAPLVNLNGALKGTRISNSELLATLRSLTRHTRNLWACPFIVLVAKRTEVTKAFHSKSRKSDGLTVQVYIGRLLFELIACHDIKVLFEALRPSVPYTPVPELPQHNEVFTRSNANSEDSDSEDMSFSSILRNAESLGYEGLTEQQTQKIGEVLNVKLYPFQQQTVRWMLDMENGPYALNDFFWEERSFTGSNSENGGTFYYFPLTGELRLRTPPSLRGGMITEEMGLGKTIEALAVIAAQSIEHKPHEVNIWCDKNPSDLTVRDGFVCMKRARQKNSERAVESSPFHHGDEVLEDSPDEDFPKNVKVRRWPAKTTLVVCPKQLIGQWKQEAQQRAPSLSVELWEFDPEKDDDDSESDEDSTIEHKKEAVAVGENAKDVVIVSYEALRKDHMLSRICWRRVILDEAQMTRRSTTQIAQDVFNLRSRSRFLMTGTPIVNSINDLKGELAMLKVWPFTLDNDGFWELHILSPFHRDQGIPLLDHLLNVTMMRHTKGQNLGITLPPRTYETIEIDLVGSHRASYCYVLGSCLDELEAQGTEDIDTRRLRIFMRLMVTICLSPGSLDLSALDLARRFTWSRRPAAVASRFSVQPGVRPEIRKLSPSEAIRFVAESAGRVVRHTQRSFATGHANISNELDRFLRMSIQQLRQEVLSQQLVSEGRVRKLRKERLAALAAGGVYRLATDTLQELRRTAVQVGIAQEAEAKTFSRATAMARLQQHYDLLNGIERTRTVHESGFSGITKIMEHRGSPSCPICLTDCDERVSVTKCGHIYCLDCILLMLESSSNFSRCAICRREVSVENVVEIIRPKRECEMSEDADTVIGQKDEADECSDSQPDDESIRQRGTMPVEESHSERREEVTIDVEESASEDNVQVPKPTAEDAWNEYEQLGTAPSRFNALGRNPNFPSLDAGFLRHLAAVKHNLEAPKLSALYSLIESTSESTKFCVVAASLQSLGVIHDYLSEKGVTCVGAGVSPNQRGAAMNASSEFRENPNVRVFLLNPANASGLTLIAAEYVIFMETLVRVADEVQAAARVHRIGQTKPVKIIRMVARNTIEELMVQQRGEIRSPQEESKVLSAVSTRDASDRLILDLLRDES